MKKINQDANLESNGDRKITVRLSLLLTGLVKQFSDQPRFTYNATD